MTAHFTGTLTGRSATHAVRDGTKASGISALFVSKNSRLFVRLYHEDGKDMTEVWIGEGMGKETCVYRGPVNP